jgi:hypothetical protein
MNTTVPSPSTLHDFEQRIVDHWTQLNEEAIEFIDLLDATMDFFGMHPKIDPEDVAFSDAFKDRLKIDAIARKLLNLNDKEKTENEELKNTHELEL